LTGRSHSPKESRGVASQIKIRYIMDVYIK